MDFNQTIEELTKKAELGDPESQYILGRKYREGGVDIEDHDKAKYYFLKAASQNFSPAEFMLGIGEMNEKKAIEWLQKSASHGYGYAYLELGKRYFHGRGVRKNCKKAIECYEKAAEFGDPSIQYEVAYIFEVSVKTPTPKKQNESNVKYMPWRKLWHEHFTQMKKKQSTWRCGKRAA